MECRLCARLDEMAAEFNAALGAGRLEDAAFAVTALRQELADCDSGMASEEVACLMLHDIQQGPFSGKLPHSLALRTHVPVFPDDGDASVFVSTGQFMR